MPGRTDMQLRNRFNTSTVFKLFNNSFDALDSLDTFDFLDSTPSTPSTPVTPSNSSKKRSVSPGSTLTIIAKKICPGDESPPPTMPLCETAIKFKTTLGNRPVLHRPKNLFTDLNKLLASPK